jgi:DNA primase
MISQSSIEEVKGHIDIIDTISNYIELKKTGSTYKACCPFHNEKTPSFVVSPKKQIYHCFGCGVSGDSIKFLMEYEKLSYVETIEKLASNYNISLQYTKEKTHSIDFSILEVINNYYKRCFNNNQAVIAYIKQRGVFESSVEKFDIGYAGNNQDFLNFLSSKDIDLNQAFKLGIVGKGNDKQHYGVFRDRIIFPIYSQQSKLVGFGGRTVVNHSAKYVNSPQSIVFNKSRLLYGYSQARSNIISKDEIVITEGYLDVILLHQAGFSNSVATLGTAMTKEHIPIISKLTKNIILAYDGDNAGKTAGYKAMLLIVAHNLQAKVALFKDGEDPADLVKENKIQDITDIFKQAQDGIEYIFDFIVSKYDLLDIHQKQQALNESMVLFKTLDTILQYEYKSYLATLLRVDDSIITIKKEKAQKRITIENEDNAELRILKTILTKPSLLEESLEFIENDMFIYHKKDFLEILQNKDCDYAIKIMLRDDIEELNDNDFLHQITILMARFYKNLRKRKLKEDLKLDEKSYIMRKIQENISMLEANKLPLLKDNISKYFN